ncbi:MAG: hypothetical protein WEB87_07505 [Bacteriovoracaceae bacterium]
MRLFLLAALFLGNAQVSGKELGRLYFQNFMGHLHKEPVDSSASLTALQCAHSVIIIEKEGKTPPSGWMLAKVGEEIGYIRSKLLDGSRPECFQEKYPRFYNRLGLDLTDYYYWGRLPDHFLEGESQAK